VRFFAALFLTVTVIPVACMMPALAQQGQTAAPSYQSTNPYASPPPQQVMQPVQQTASPQQQPAQPQPPAQPQQSAAAPAPNPIADMLATQTTPPPTGVVPVMQSTSPAMIAAPPQEQLVPQDPAPVAEAIAEPKSTRDFDRVEMTNTQAAEPEQPAVNMDVTDTAAANAMLDTPIENEIELAPMNNTGINMDLEPSLVADDGGSDEMGVDGAVAVEEELPYEEQLRIRTKEIEQRAREMAFEQSKRSALPLETYQIRDLLRRLKATQEAIQKPVNKAPTPQNVIKTISVDPAAKSEIINMAVGNVTALNIVDMTGAPWPIVDIAFGGNFDVKAPEPGGSILRITPLRDFAQGNMVIRLLKMQTPITFTLMAGGETVNYRFDARIPSYGPNARMPIVEEGIKTVAGDSIINSVLEGVAPNRATKLKVEGIDQRTSAYLVDGTLYVRTPLTMLSPSWRGSATSADGMNVYVLAEAPVVLLSDQGNLVRARLSAASKSVGE
jgi:intracellular multiplication protein IcmK